MGCLICLDFLVKGTKKFISYSMIEVNKINIRIIERNILVKEKQEDENMTTPKLPDQVDQVMRIKHISISTEVAYVDWIERYIIYYGNAGEQS